MLTFQAVRVALDIYIVADGKQCLLSPSVIDLFLRFPPFERLHFAQH